MRRNRIQKLLALALTGALILGIAVLTATAQDTTPTVIFDAAAGTFSFENAQKYTDTSGERTYVDLFPHLKDLMPGDTLSQTIAVRVKNAGSNTVKLTLRCDGESGYETLTKGKSDNNPAASTYPATLSVNVDGTAYNGTLTGVGAAQGVYLGGYTATSPEKELTVALQLPKEAGNEFQDLTAQVGWIFTAEVIPPPSPSNDTVQLNKVDHFAYIIGRRDGLIHPEAEITRGEIATIFFRMLTENSRNEYWASSNPYTDIAPTTWCNHAVSTLSNAGILHGYSDGTFRPAASITRGEFAAMAARFFHVSKPGTDSFSDIAEHWAREDINKAAAAGIIKGYADGTFRPENPITRAEAITIINRVLGRAPDAGHLVANMITWPDNQDTAAWYYADIQEATNSHEYTLVKGTVSQAAYERWLKLLAVRNWAAFEEAWADQNAAQNPGEVISSDAVKK